MVGRSFKRLVDHFLHSPFILVFIGMVNLRCLAVGGGVGVRICEQRADGGQYGPDVVDGAPLILQDCINKYGLSRQILPSL
jgi:hypothetical protein